MKSGSVASQFLIRVCVHFRENVFSVLERTLPRVAAIVSAVEVKSRITVRLLGIVFGVLMSRELTL
jgi:hypothetical protein